MFSDIYFRILFELIKNEPTLTLPPSSKLDELGQSENGSLKKFTFLIDHVYGQNENSNVGLSFGKHMTAVNSCDFTRLLSTCSTAKEGLDRLTQYCPILGLRPFPSIYQSKKTISLSLAYPYKEEHSYGTQRFCAEMFFCFYINSVREIFDKNINPISVHFDFSKPDYHSEYEAFFKCPIYYNSPLAIIKCDNSFTQVPMPTSNLVVNNVYKEKADDIWLDIKRNRSMRYRSITQMMQKNQSAMNAELLAESLNISKRGLQKRLKSEGCSFSEIQNLVRRELTKIYLVQRNMDLNDVKQRLGFQTQSTFRKFFLQNFSCTPNEYINSLS